MFAVNRVANANSVLFKSVTSQHKRMPLYRNAFCGFCFIKTRFGILDINLT